ncbi:MAG: insulinase family protein [Cyanobacteria bacterium NC_groundwater_1444_Ag_S-0.65um_54_12]|nr:insulinase family protein [Cyanobacteria bacterium NC_groundwater_1444_Ag_S-0.65um_54_12]
MARQVISTILVCLLLVFPPAWREPLLLAASAATDIAIPRPLIFNLENGLKVLFLERHQLPIVNIQLVLRAGAVADPPGKSGVAALTADLLTKGTLSRTAKQLAEAMDFMGGSFSTYCDEDKSVVQLALLKRDLAVGLELFTDSLLQPLLATEELARVREQWTASLNSTLDDANAVLELAANQNIYGTHPYSRLVHGTLSSLTRIESADLRAFYHKFYFPRNAFLVVVGDLTVAELRAALQGGLGAWHGNGAGLALPALPEPQLSGRQVRLIDMEVNQSFIQLENVAIPRRHADFFPLLLMANILGGGSLGRLYRDIRDKQGLAYGAYSSLMPRLHTGKLTLELQTKVASTEQALKSLLGAMEDMRTSGPTDEELGHSKEYFTGSFALRLEANSDLASQVVNQEFYELGDDYLTSYQSQVKAVTRQQVHEVARRYLDPTRYALTIVTKTTGLAGQLAKFGKVTEVERKSLID